jgi:hypothetical protein
MSKNNESAKLAIHASSSNSFIRAFAKVGNGSSWTTANSSRKLQIRSCGRGLLHQMGGSESIGEYYSTNNLEILLAKHNLQIGVPKELIVDNVKQFDCYSFKKYCKPLGTHAKFSSVYHPQSNGAVEEQMSRYFQESRSACLIKRRASGTMNCRK